MSSIIPSDFQKEELEKDQNCGLCGTLVKAGYSVCPGCQAMYGTRIKDYDALLRKANTAGSVMGISGLAFIVTLLYCLWNSKPYIGGYIGCALSFAGLVWSIKVARFYLRNRKIRTEKEWWKFGVSVY